VHRDIKPANVLLDKQEHVRLADFGIAQPEVAMSLTQSGMVVGTARYLVPEVAAGQPATARSDLHAAGLVIRELAEARNAPDLAALIAALAETCPEHRPRSAQTALDLIDAAQSSRAIQKLSSTAPTRPVVSSRPTMATATVITASPTPSRAPCAPAHPGRQSDAWAPCGRGCALAVSHPPSPSACSRSCWP
jgi:eukaryotic-like serine/threonine-protein kinase